MLKIRHLIGLLCLVSICFLYVVWYIFKQRDLTGPDAEKFSDIFGHAVRWKRSDGIVNNEFRVHSKYRHAEKAASSVRGSKSDLKGVAHDISGSFSSPEKARNHIPVV